MLSSKLKSWMESHLTRKKSSGSNSSKKSASGYHGGGGGTTTTSSSGSYKELSPADRIAHPASSLVNLVPAVPLCSTSGRSNAGLVIRLQNDFREQQHSSAQSPCHLVRHQQHHHHPSWTRSPVMLAWNTKIPPPTPTPTIPLKDPPISPPPSSSSSTIIQQSGEPSPTGSDWTSKSFADESGIGGSRTDNREGSLSSSSKANTTTGSSIGTADFPHHHHHHESRRMNAPSLSSPESAYSTGCSADGVSPSQDGMFDANFNQPLTASAALLLDPVWRRSTLEADASGSNSTSSTQSPRTRPAIRTNPWLPVRTSLTSAGSTTGSDRVSWMTDSTPEAALSEMCPPPVKQTDIVASSSSSSQEEEDSDPVAAAMAACAANDELDQLCDSLQLLMDGDRLRVITASGAQPMKTTVAPLAAAYHQSPAPDRRRWEATAVDVDDQYTLLIRQTEEILLQLEKDELLLASRKNLNQAEENELSHPAKSSSVLLHPVVVKASNSSSSNNNNNSRPCSASSASGLQPQRRRLRKTAASRRRCSSSSRNSALVYSSSSSSSSSESSDCEYLDSNNRRMLLATTSASDWNASRRPRSVNRNNSFSSSSKGITPRFASRQNVRVLPHPPPQQQQQPLPVPARDCWILSSQRTSCSPDDWTTEHDRPPSPAPLDPHCHWSSVAHPSVQLRNSERMMTPTRSPSISSCSSNSRRNSRQFRDVRQQQQRHHHQSSSGPTSPAIRLDWDDDYHHQTTPTTTTTNSSSCSTGGPAGRRWRQSMTREQQRLESQIAFLRRQLKDVTDDYYDYDARGGGPSASSTTSDSSSHRLK